MSSTTCGTQQLWVILYFIYYVIYFPFQGPQNDGQVGVEESGKLTLQS